MQKRFDHVLNKQGNALQGIRVTVKDYPAGTLANIYAADGSDLIGGSYVTTNGKGYYEYYAADGRYTEEISGPGIETTIIQDVLIEDATADLADSTDDTQGDALVAVKLEASGSVATTQHARNESLPLRSDFSSDADHESAADAAGAQLLASQSRFKQSGTGATEETVDAALKHLPLRGQFNSDTNFDSAVAAIASPQLSALQAKFVQAGPDAATRILQTKVREIVSVTDFKNTDGSTVAGDGAQDDATGIAKAIASTGMVYFPKPSVRYRVVGTIDIANSVCLVGDGFSEIWQATANATTFAVSAGVEWFSCRGMKFTGTGALSTQGRASIDLNPSASSTKVKYVYIDGNYFADPSVCGFATDSCEKVIVSNNIFNDVGEHAIYLSGCLDATVIGNIIDSPVGAGIQLRSGSEGGGRITIVGNVIRNAGTDSIVQTDLMAGETVISGNYLDSSTDNHIQFTNGTSIATVSITGNYFKNAGNNDVEFSNVSNVLFVGNTSHDSSFASLRLNTCSRITITGNQFYDFNSSNTAGRGAVHFSGGGDSLITGNTFVSQYANARAVGGQSSPTNNVIMGNDVRGLAIAEANRITVGTGYVVRNNIGFTTENSGTGSIASGATTATVTHGLAVTPTLDDISIVFGEQGTNDYGRFWIDTIGASTFRVNVSADPGASNLDFAWRAVCL